jgi:hypothetical protein
MSGHWQQGLRTQARAPSFGRDEQSLDLGATFPKGEV